MVRKSSLAEAYATMLLIQRLPCFDQPHMYGVQAWIMDVP